MKKLRSYTPPWFVFLIAGILVSHGRNTKATDLRIEEKKDIAENQEATTQKDLRELIRSIQGLKTDVLDVKNILALHGQDIFNIRQHIIELEKKIGIIPTRATTARFVPTTQTPTTTRPVVPTKKTDFVYYPKGTRDHRAPKCIVRNRHQLRFVGFGLYKARKKETFKHASFDQCVNQSFNYYTGGESSFGMWYDFTNRVCYLVVSGDVSHTESSWYLHYRMTN